MGWWSRKPKPEEIPESPQEDLDYEYEEPERGPFDWPHRIRSQEQLDIEAEAPLPDDAALRVMEHNMQSRQAREEAEEFPVDPIEGLLVAEDEPGSEAQAMHLDQIHRAERISAAEFWMTVRGTRAGKVFIWVVDKQARFQARQKK